MPITRPPLVGYYYWIDIVIASSVAGDFPDSTGMRVQTFDVAGNTSCASKVVLFDVERVGKWIGGSRSRQHITQYKD
jgi:hypothetical protein